MENLEKILKAELLLLEFFLAENLKERLKILIFSQHFCDNAEKFLKKITVLTKMWRKS